MNIFLNDATCQEILSEIKRKESCELWPLEWFPWKQNLLRGHLVRLYPSDTVGKVVSLSRQNWTVTCEFKGFGKIKFCTLFGLAFSNPDLSIGPFQKGVVLPNPRLITKSMQAGH